MDRLTALTVFRTAVDRGSFAAAARHLGLSPAAVSKNMAELEAQLGVRLLHRTTRTMGLTEAGARYHAQVCRILDDLEQADRSLGALQDEPRGTLRVSAPMTLSLLSVTARVPEFLARHPELSLDLHLDDRQVDLVRDGFDLAVRGTDHLEDSSLVAKAVMRMPHVVCASPAYLHTHGTPATPEALADHACVQFSLSAHADVWRFARGRQAVEVAVGGRYRVTSSLAVRDAVRAGAGLALMPRRYVQADLDAGTLVSVLDDWSTHEATVYAVYPSRQYLDPKVRAFVGFLGEVWR